VLTKLKYFNPQLLTKSGFMVGLGEDAGDVHQTITDLQKSKIDILTIGQYLCPDKKQNWPVQAVITVEQFQQYRQMAAAVGIKTSLIGPLVRSSYKAAEIYQQLQKESSKFPAT
jgi:lipoic acid synthetase